MKDIIRLKIKFGFWITSAIIIGIFFSSLLLKGVSYKQTESQKSAAIVIESLASEETTPQYFYFTKDPSQKPKVGAGAYLVGDLDTGEIILTKNEDRQFPIASVSKLMTATLATELMKPDDIASVSKKALSTYGENGNLKLGEKIKISDLIYPLLLESSNDAGEVIAEYFGRDIFIKKMNQMALKLELSKTTFEDPSGLSIKNQSTVFDMFKLAGYINQKNPGLLKITTEKSYSNKKHIWFSNNQFLHEDGYLGGKSGYTDPALQTVVSLFSIPLGESGARNIAITLLQSKDRYKDVESILKYLNKNIYYGGETDANTAWVKERTDIPFYDQDFVALSFGGDMMLDRGVESSVNKNFNGDYSILFEKLGILKKSDIAFANLEGPASDTGKDMRNLYSFRMSPSVIPALKGAGLSIVSVSNNHAGDWGRDAYSDTLANLKENEILYTGGGINESEAEQPIVIEKYGMKIGYLGFSDVGPNWMKATGNEAGVLLASNPRFDEIVQNASKQVDYLVVTFHFGEEYQTEHNARQEYLAHKAIDAGAKIIIGTHPHVVEDTEVYKNGFIAYSLGNLIFDQGFSQNTMQGMLLEIKLNRDGSMSIKKNTVKLNKFFQPDKIILGKEEKVVFEK
ncbi:MAG: CapA family protein [Candidatus Paceibacterota bacterium]|jgi:poly-gamma-glutamate synthesis protein (capsule biosynthesis protein)